MRAALFPGQGSQSVGMAHDLYDAIPAARDVLDRSESVLGFPLKQIMFEGPEETLVRTGHAQPAIFTHSLALWTAWGESRPTFHWAAGHSLGEFSALTAAGAWDFETGLRLVQVRSSAMQKACDEHPGTMAALTQLPADRLEALLHGARAGEILEAANFNSDGQIVISGERPAVERAVELAGRYGARRATLLKVGGAFHSPLMAGAQSELGAALDDADIRKPDFPVLLNVTAKPTTDPSEIRAQLKAQLTSPVLWQQTMIRFGELGMQECVEIGPGKVLQGLMRRTLPDAGRSGIETAENLSAVTSTASLSS